MRKLSEREEEIMGFFWRHGDMFVREVVELYEDPKPHFNTVATFVRGLEAKGFLRHEKLGNSFRFGATVSPEEYGRSAIPRLVDRLFGGSCMNMVSTLVKEEAISADDLRELLREIEEEGRP